MRRLLLSTKEVMFMNIQPNVFAVGNDYQIIVTCDKEALLWIKIGDKCLYVNIVIPTEQSPFTIVNGILKHTRHSKILSILGIIA